MGPNTVINQKRGVHRLNSRVFKDQIVFIKSEVKRRKNEDPTPTESDVLRDLLDEAIISRKTKSRG